MKEEEAIKQRFERVAGELNERTRRLLAASEAMALGRGGISAVSRATGVSRHVIRNGIKELQGEHRIRPGRVRRVGGGRKTTGRTDASVSEDLERLGEPVTRADPESVLRWTWKRVRKRAQELQQRGHRVSYQWGSEWVHAWGYSFQANRKTREGGEHADRDAPCEHLNAQAQPFLAKGEPVIAVDAKKKERVGDCTNAGQEWHPQGEPEEGRVSDFPIPGLGRVTPYGVSDQGRHAGRVHVGSDHETAAVAVESIRRWWSQVGKLESPEAKRLLISADGGGSNGSRVRLWKWEWQPFAAETGRSITVCHVPPGTSTWNKIEHRLFSFLSQNWRGKLLLTYEVIITRIAATNTTKGLMVQSMLDTRPIRSDAHSPSDFRATIRVQRHDVHGEWNSTILPRPSSV